MKSIFSICITLLALSVFLSGCSPGDKAKTESTTSKTKVDTETFTPSHQESMPPKKMAPTSTEALAEKEAKETLETEKAAVFKKFEKTCGPSPTGKGGPMCLVPGGPFLMGYNAKLDGEAALDVDSLHKVLVNTFYIDRHEVTVAEFTECIQAQKCEKKNLSKALWYSGLEKKPEGFSELSEESPFCTWKQSDKGNHPINCISWQDADDYCTWAGKRLPSEKEWEKAARGVKGDKYPWGNSGISKTDIKTNIDGLFDGYEHTAPVEQFTKGVSPYGAWDMMGNVEEWVNDWFVDNEVHGPEWEEVVDKETYKMMKGGSMSSDILSASPHQNDQMRHENRLSNVGFRCAYSPGEKPAAIDNSATETESPMHDVDTAVPEENSK